MTTTDPRALPIPDESRAALRDLDDEGMWRRGQVEVPDDVADHWATVVAGPVVVAELLALADRLNALTASAGARYREGFDAAIGEVRDLIADRCDELGVKVEEP